MHNWYGLDLLLMILFFCAIIFVLFVGSTVLGWYTAKFVAWVLGVSAGENELPNFIGWMVGSVSLAMSFFCVCTWIVRMAHG